MGKAYGSVRAGLVEAAEHARGRQAGVKIYRPAPAELVAARAGSQPEGLAEGPE